MEPGPGSFAGCRGWEGDHCLQPALLQPPLPLEPGERGLQPARPDLMGPAGTAWGMDVSGLCGGAGSSPAPWMAGRTAGPSSLINTRFHTLQTSGARRPVRAPPLGSRPKIQPQTQLKVQPQIQQGCGAQHPPRTATQHPCPVADKPYTSQHPPAPRLRPAPASALGHSSASAQGPSGLDLSVEFTCGLALHVWVRWDGDTAPHQPEQSPPPAGQRVFSRGSGNLAAPQAIATVPFYF